MTAMVGPGVKIEYGVPIPPPDHRAGRNGRPRRWYWERLDIGDSFVSLNDRLAQMSLHWAKTNGRVFTSRKTRRGVRVWRIA